MIGKVIRPSKDFAKALNYLMQKEKAEVLHYRGVRGYAGQGDIVRDFELQARLNPGIRSPVGHFVLSFSKEDTPKLGSRDQRKHVMRERALEYLGRMRVRDTQVLIVRHFDREPQGLHMHLLFNRVSDSGKGLESSFLKYNNRRVCHEMTVRYGYSNGEKGLYAVNTNRLRGYERARFQVKTAVQTHLKTSNNLQELKAQLKAAYGIDMRFRKHPDTGEVLGVSYRHKNIALKAVHTGLSYLKLKAHFQRKQLRERPIRYRRVDLQQKSNKRQRGLRI